MSEGFRELLHEEDDVVIPARLADVYIYDREVQEERMGRKMSKEEEAEFAKQWMSPEGEENAS